MAEPYLQLAKDLSHLSSDLIVAKIDGTKNEVKGLVIDGYPSMYFYPKGKGKTPIHYNGKRTLKAMTNFIKKKLGKDWKEKQN